MTAKPIEGRTWTGRATNNTVAANSLVLEETSRDDEAINVWVAAPDDGPSVQLTAAQARELSRDLVKRADRIDPPKRRRWVDTPRTPEAILAAFLSDANKATEEVWEDPPSEIDVSWMRSMAVVDNFTLVVLLTELMAAAPHRAQVVARVLYDAWEDGGSIHEWIWEWHEKHSKGQPIGLDPALVLELEVERPEEYR
ncbi:hypothetical protein Lesp02_70310 [Lentzea sp. NBRC 105346]|uniref:hypothetical protein n=1 Tax=Lentzea sp. NBRC 105346 TaxID=3032205 RepID=UPI00249FFAF7|nr:hypothetical protein [Lentzea sp. NBRC 105346]GLZ34844.1 hypothetical protein Lesp02_70310 [Lentzea sp. NBRC 105346]